MKTIASLHIGNLLKSCAIVLLILTVAWSIVSLLVAGDILIGPFILILNLVLSVLLGFLFYKQRYHAVLAYDDEGFQLQRGRTLFTGKWTDFSQVSLMHLGYGKMAVRLYKDKDDFLDIPTADLKVDAWQLRFELIGLVKGAKDKPPED